jgi:hypothetical protein
MAGFVLKDWAAWAPGFEDDKAWRIWADGEGSLSMDKSVPSLDHLAPVARRRLSQLTKMVLHVGHRLLDGRQGMKTYFCSRFGEIAQQRGITGRLIDQGDVRPAAFSLSVFNTPVSHLSIHEGLREGITVLLAGENGLINALSPLLSQMIRSPGEDFLLLFADELLPDEYRALSDSDGRPFAFGLILSSEGKGMKIEYDLDGLSSGGFLNHPLDLLQWLLNDKTKTARMRCNGLHLNVRKGGS